MTVVTHGTSRFVRFAHERGSRPSSESCDSVRAAPASGCIVPMNMLATMNQTAADFAMPASSGANVGPSVSLSSPPMPLSPIVPSQTSGRTMKKTPAIAPLAKTARGRFFTGSRISPTWHVAASKAGAAKPMR